MARKVLPVFEGWTDSASDFAIINRGLAVAGNAVGFVSPCAQIYQLAALTAEGAELLTTLPFHGLATVRAGHGSLSIHTHDFAAILR